MKHFGGGGQCSGKHVPTDLIVGHDLTHSPCNSDCRGSHALRAGLDLYLSSKHKEGIPNWKKRGVLLWDAVRAPSIVPKLMGMGDSSPSSSGASGDLSTAGLWVHCQAMGIIHLQGWLTYLRQDSHNMK